MHNCIWQPGCHNHRTGSTHWFDTGIFLDCYQLMVHWIVLRFVLPTCHLYYQPVVAIWRSPVTTQLVFATMVSSEPAWQKCWEELPCKHKSVWAPLQTLPIQKCYSVGARCKHFPDKSVSLQTPTWHISGISQPLWVFAATLFGVVELLYLLVLDVSRICISRICTWHPLSFGFSPSVWKSMRSRNEISKLINASNSWLGGEVIAFGNVWGLPNTGSWSRQQYF